MTIFQDWISGLASRRDTFTQTVTLLDKDRKPTDVIHPGDLFYASYEVIQRVPCVYHLAYRVAKTYDEHAAVVVREPYSWPETINLREAGHYRVNELLKLPDYIPSGNYLLKRTAYYTCSANTFVLQPSADYRFRIEP